MSDKLTNFTVAESYVLPSGGKIYDKPVNPQIELRSMTGRDEMKRLNPSATPLKTLAEIIEGCLLEKPAVHVYDMCLGDYEYLLHKLRIVTYGDEYNMGLICPYCGKEVDAKTHLEELIVKDFDQEQFESLRTFTLPVSQKVVALKFQTPRTIDTIELKAQEMRRKYKGSEIDFDTMVKLSEAIDTVDGTKIGAVDMENYINHLPARDMNKILNNIEAINGLVGLDTTLYVTCDKCHADIKTCFRMGPEFFRPTNI